MDSSRSRTDVRSRERAAGLIRVAGLTKTWHTFRVVTASAFVLSGAMLGVVWDWSAGLVAAGLSIIALFDALIRRRNPGSPHASIYLDITLTGLAILVVGLEPVAVAGPLVYMLGVPLLLLPLRQAVPAMLYSLAWSILAIAGVTLMDASPHVLPEAITAVAMIVFGGHTLALIAVVSHQLEVSYRSRERRLAYENALANCGEELLTAMDERAIDYALEALLEAAPGQNIFVDENIVDPDLGLCARVTHEAIRPGFEDLVSEEIWEEPGSPVLLHSVIPYRELPNTYGQLSRGRVAQLITRELSGREREIYDEDGCKSELNIPIYVGAEWVGSIGIADYIIERRWSKEDIRVLRTAAAMIGSFWERRRAFARYEELARSKDQFLASISHEIRTPLTAVLGFSRLLDDEDLQLTADGRDHVRLIGEQAQEVSDIVEDLLVAARADIDDLSVHPKRLNLQELVVGVVDSRPLPREQTLEFSGDEVEAFADPLRVRQIARCLLSNAARYGGSEVEIRTVIQGNRATLAVIDNGDGIPDAEQADIFEPFQRAHSVEGRTQAIGLGLFVARELARLMGGGLAYRRDLERTVFELTLPLPQIQAEAMDVGFLDQLGD